VLLTGTWTPSGRPELLHLGAGRQRQRDRLGHAPGGGADPPQYRWDRTIKIIFFTGEEQGSSAAPPTPRITPWAGSRLLNLDMFGWDSNGTGAWRSTSAPSPPPWTWDLLQHQHRSYGLNLTATSSPPPPPTAPITPPSGTWGWGPSRSPENFFNDAQRAVAWGATPTRTTHQQRQDRDQHAPELRDLHRQDRRWPRSRHGDPVNACSAATPPSRDRGNEPGEGRKRRRGGWWEGGTKGERKPRWILSLVPAGAGAEGPANYRRFVFRLLCFRAGYGCWGVGKNGGNFVASLGETAATGDSRIHRRCRTLAYKIEGGVVD
jgi:hypothetical protein